jgi:hypothetical protein
VKSIVKHKHIKFVFASICSLLITIYFFFFVSSIQIEIFNKTNFDIDSLNINGKFYKLKKQKTLIIKDCKKLSIQDNLPFGPPVAVIKNMKRDTTPVFLCGAEIDEVENGNYKFNIEALVENHSYILFWTEHK